MLDTTVRRGYLLAALITDGRAVTVHRAVQLLADSPWPTAGRFTVQRDLAALDADGYLTASDRTGRRVYLVSRFWAKVTVGTAAECWPWTAGTNSHGYGAFRVGGTVRGAHTIAAVYRHGPVPVGHVVDHRCHNEDTTCPGGDQCAHRQCVNPHHLDVVTIAENTARGMAPNAVAHREDRCVKAGHPFTVENTVSRRDGRRRCRTCYNDWQRARYAARTAA